MIKRAFSNLSQTALFPEKMDSFLYQLNSDFLKFHKIQKENVNHL